MIETMSANIIYTEQKKRNTQGCDITKYFNPPTKVNSVPSQLSPVSPEEIPDYFKRNCAPLDLSQPTVFPRSSIENEGSESTQLAVASKWSNVKEVSRCDALAYKDDVGMERFERQIFQELDSRMCHELDSKVAEEDEISSEQRMYDAGLSMKYERDVRTMTDPQSNLLSLAEQQQQQQQLMSEKGTPTITNAFNVMMTNNRSLNTQEMCSAVSKETPTCANYLYAEPQTYKWVSDLPSALEDMKGNINESKLATQSNLGSNEGAAFEGGQSTIDVLPPSCIKEMPVDPMNVNQDVPIFPASMSSEEIRERQEQQQRNANAARDDAVQVISYEDFLKSEGISVPSKDKPEQEVATAEPITKKQSNIRRFFTRVPRTVEVKFDHKRLVTVTAVVHPQPQSPRKLPAKKTNNKRQSPRRPIALRSGNGKNNNDAKHASYNTRQRKSNVVVDNEEIDLSIEEMGLEKTVDKPARKRLQRPKLQERNDNLSKKTIYSGSCNNMTNQNGNDDRWVLRPRLESATGGRKSARLNPHLESNNQVVNSEDDESSLRSHKPLRSIYKSTVVQRDSSGLRLKLTRIGRKHHHRHRHHPGHRHKKHKSAKMQRAMQLLQKAKDSSVPRDLHATDSGVRRSPRQSSVIVRKAMEGAARAEELRQARITAQRLVPKKRLRVRRRLRMMNKKSELNLRSQAGVKMSPTAAIIPINTKKIINSTDSGSANKKPETIANESREQLRENESSRLLPSKQTEITSKTSVVITHGQEDLALLKPVIHVQQRENDNFSWTLPSATLNYRTTAIDEGSAKFKIASAEKIQLGILSSMSGKVSECYKSQVDKLSSYSAISKRLPSHLVTQILKDVASRFPNFSAFKLYRRYKLKHRQALNFEDAFQSRGADNKKRPSNTAACAIIKKHRATSEVVDLVVEEKENAEETVSEPKSIKLSHLQWTDKYQPSHSADVIGNGRVMRHMKQWLVDWREKCKLEAKQKQVKPENKEKSKGSWDDDDSDFLLSDANDDSNLDDYRLCNTMLVSGPSGTGKTAAIYALAEELGYKVFEINATSKRVGKQVLIQLQEATQSHQVIVKAKPINAFFESKKESQPSMKTETKAARKEYSQDVPTVSTTISLVLFEDVDLVFEEDEGFVQAVNTFMATTKRPIILTTSNATFDSTKIKGRCEELKFEIPNAALTATYLQVMCLAENIQTEFDDIMRLVEFNRGDVRRSILELQYWLLSGGDPRAAEDALNKLRSEMEDNDDAGKKSGVLDEPDSTMSSLLDCPHDESSSDSFDETATKTERSAAVHRGSFQQIHGLTVPSSIPLLASLQTADVKSLTLLMEQCHSLGVPLTLSNLPHLLSLPTWGVKANGDQIKTSLGQRPGKDDEQFRKEVCGKSMSALSRLQDNLSWMDSNLNANDCACAPAVGWWKWWYREPQPSEVDEASSDDVISQLPRSREFYSSVGATSAWTCSQALQKVLRNVALHENQCLPYITVPAGESFVSHDLEVDPKICNKHLQCARFVENCLPSSVQTNRRSTIVDYFPFVRSICRAEKVRHSTNTKRGGRFLHYLDAHSLPSHVLRQLSEEFP